MKYQIDYKSPMPLHIQVENILREMITEDEYRNGKLLPNEVEVSKMLGISRNTFRTAMDRLVREGLVVRKKGVGSVVNTSVISTTLTEWESFTKEMNSKGKEFKTLDKSVAWVKIGEQEAALLGTKAGTNVCVLERLKGEGTEPVVFFKSFFHPRVGIDAEEDFNGRLYAILEEKYHSVPAISKEEIGAFKCDAFLSSKLGIKEGEPVLYRKRIVSNAAGKQLELCYAYYRADRFVYNIQIMR